MLAPETGYPGEESMASRVGRLVLSLSLLVAVGAPCGAAASREVDTKRFPRLVRILLLPEEAALLKELKDERDKVEFQKIFWARRDPTPGTPANEFENNVRAVWANADSMFAYPNQKGSETGCGQVLALLGRPEEVRGIGDVPRQLTAPVAGVGGQEVALPPGSGRQFDNMAYLREGATHEPETWVYRDRPGLPYTFTGAELRIALDAECRYAEGAGILGDDLRRAAAAFVTRPEIAYTRGSDGHLLPLAAAAAAGTAAGAGARELLAAPRTDFPLAAESKLLLRAPKGEAYVAGLVRAAPGAASAPARLSLAAQAADAAGQAVASASRDATVAPQADGSLVASWGLSLKPGRYKVTVAALLPEAGRGSASAIDVEVPDFGGASLVVSPLVVYPDEPAAAGAADPRDPYAAMQLGPLRLHPRFGNVFTPSDSLMVVATLYGAKVDAASGQAAMRSRYSILRNGRPVARGAEDAFTTADAVAAVGPIPLSGYEPGAYAVRLDVTDAVANATVRQEVPFEIRKP
jgi:GWxTD domain-containing protein